MEPKIILCECGKAFRIPVPEAGENLPCEWEEDERGEECIQKGHKMNALTVLFDSFISGKSSTEVVKTLYFYAEDENGKRWVVKQERRALGDPCRREAFRGKISVRIKKLTVQEKGLSRSLLAEAFKAGIALSQEKIELLIAYLNNQIQFGRYFDDRYRDIEDKKYKGIYVSEEHPLVIFVPLRDTLVLSLLSFCRQFWQDKECQFLEKFIKDENREDGDLVLRGEREFEIIHY